MARRDRKTSRNRVRKRGVRKTRKGSNSNLWWGVIGASVLLIIGVLAISQSLVNKKAINEYTLCHSSGPTNATVILLDVTDPLNGTQQARLRTIINNEIALSDIDTSISMGVVSEFPDRWGAMFSKCKPATGGDANSLYENPTLIADRYNREFLSPINEKIDTTLSSAKENQSPIMEALQALIAGSPDFSNVKGRRKIILVSDMLQHSDNLSFYRGQGWDYFVSQDGEKRFAESLVSAEIEIIRIPRIGNNIPPDQLVEGFWTRYFDKQGSRAPNVSSLGDL